MATIMTCWDFPFILATKLATIVLLIAASASYSNDYFRDIDVNCESHFGPSKLPDRQWMSTDSKKSDLEEYCFKHDMFLVTYALNSSMEGGAKRDGVFTVASYPGVARYVRGQDGIITIKNYDIYWGFWLIVAASSLLPYIIWLGFGQKKIKSLVQVKPAQNVPVVQVRIACFLDQIGSNSVYAGTYVICKVWATVTPLGQLYLASWFVGKRFLTYGMDWVYFHTSGTENDWENPMHAIFPMHAKCEQKYFGIDFGVEYKTAVCHLPMNHLNKWMFLIYYGFLGSIFIINILSLFQLLLQLIPKYRNHRFLKFVKRVTYDDVENICIALGREDENCENIFVNCELAFSDFLVLNFMKKNLTNEEFLSFFRKLVLTNSSFIHFSPEFTNLEEPFSPSTEIEMSPVRGAAQVV